MTVSVADYRGYAIGGAVIIGALSPISSRFDNTLAGVAVGGYLIGAAFHGNLGKLADELKQEPGYLYFLGSLVAIGALHTYGPTSKIADALLLLSIAGVAVRVIPAIDFSSFKAALSPQTKG